MYAACFLSSYKGELTFTFYSLLDAFYSLFISLFHHTVRARSHFPLNFLSVVGARARTLYLSLTSAVSLFLSLVAFRILNSFSQPLAHTHTV